MVLGQEKHLSVLDDISQVLYERTTFPGEVLARASQHVRSQSRVHCDINLLVGRQFAIREGFKDSDSSEHDLINTKGSECIPIKLHFTLDGGITVLAHGRCGDLAL